MRKIFFIAAAIYIAAASCAWAGTFDGLAAAASVKPPTPLFMQPGSIVKTEFKANIRPDSDADLGADFSSVAQAAAKNQAQPKPAVAYRERRSGSMAPPPTAKQSDRSSTGRMVAADAEEPDLETDLEKDLVISPPPPKTGADRTPTRKSAAEKKAVEKKPAITEKKVEKPKAEPRVRKLGPAEYQPYAVSQKPIQKVRPVTRNFWSWPAGAYDNRPCPPDVSGPACSTNPAYGPSDPRGGMNRQYRPMSQEYAWPRGAQAQRSLTAAAPMNYPGDRVVRDGVTVKLAPAAAPADYFEYPEESSGSDLLSTAVEIIGMPFAFIGSLF